MIALLKKNKGNIPPLRPQSFVFHHPHTDISFINYEFKITQIPEKCGEIICSCNLLYRSSLIMSGECYENNVTFDVYAQRYIHDSEILSDGSKKVALQNILNSYRNCQKRRALLESTKAKNLANLIFIHTRRYVKN